MPAECPAERALSDFVAGQLPPGESSAISEHVRSCVRCAARLEALESGAPPADFVLPDLQAAEGVEAPEDPEFQAAVQRLISASPGRVPAVGDSVDDYRLLEPLGEGGMGVVFRAVHTRLGKEVALKVIRRNRALDPHAADRFRREMLAIGKLKHANLVQATDAGVTDGMQYLVMEYLPGTNLSRLVAASGPLPLARACELVRQAALGLHHAHEHGLVHRDVKPSNLLLGNDGVVRVLDLGLALLPNEREQPTARPAPAIADALTATGDDTLTTPGQQLGTRDYAAPEQLADSHSVTRRADIYSLGCTLAYLLTGEPYRTGEPFPPHLPGRTWARLLAPNPNDRFPTALAAAESLGEFCEKPPTDRPRRGWVVPVGVGSLVGIAVAAVLILNQPAPPTPIPPDVNPGSEANGLPTPEPPPPGEPAPPPREVPPRGTLPLTATEAVALQKRWADHIGQPVSVKNSLGMELVLIPPAAEFGMSATYRVTLTKPYRIATLETTYAQFAKFAAANPRFKSSAESGSGSASLVSWRPAREFPHPKGRPITWRAPGWGKCEDDQPITQVNWDDAAAFLKWLSAQEGRRYRLPTHAEWAWACRAGTATRYYWGPDVRDLTRYAWVRPSNVDRPQRVGQLPPNAWGLFDMIGNVSEMAQDYYQFPLPTGHAVDPSGPATGTERLCCGGHYMSSAEFGLDTLPVAVSSLTHCTSIQGFRVVLEP